MNLADFFQRRVYTVDFECGTCRIYQEPQITAGPPWLLELQIQLQSRGRRHNLVRILEAAEAIEYVPVTLEDVAQQFEAEVISGAGPWPDLRPNLWRACPEVVDLASLTPDQLETADRAFHHYPGYLKRVVRGLRRTRARCDLRRMESVLQTFSREPGCGMG